ncbi:hypothetical protein SDC9_194928 [bioreactor metagenome]|uniref:Uncharacterized protein n=1 Tax=bioreactor metagenome TaxID=1076179 RepID=A0A645I8T4_9ZZZZ
MLRIVDHLFAHPLHIAYGVPNHREVFGELRAENVGYMNVPGFAEDRDYLGSRREQRAEIHVLLC